TSVAVVVDANVDELLVTGPRDERGHGSGPDLTCLGISGEDCVVELNLLDRLVATVRHEHRRPGQEAVALGLQLVLDRVFDGTDTTGGSAGLADAGDEGGGAHCAVEGVTAGAGLDGVNGAGDERHGSGGGGDDLGRGRQEGGDHCDRAGDGGDGTGVVDHPFAGAL